METVEDPSEIAESIAIALIDTVSSCTGTSARGTASHFWSSTKAQDALDDPEGNYQWHIENALAFEPCRTASFL